MKNVALAILATLVIGCIHSEEEEEAIAKGLENLGLDCTADYSEKIEFDSPYCDHSSCETRSWGVPLECTSRPEMIELNCKVILDSEFFIDCEGRNGIEFSRRMSSEGKTKKVNEIIDAAFTFDETNRLLCLPDSNMIASKWNQEVSFFHAWTVPVSCLFNLNQFDQFYCEVHQEVSPNHSKLVECYDLHRIGEGVISSITETETFFLYF
jgi:hypothetical protein